MTARQHSFYLEDEDWKALRHYCLDHGISVSAFVAQAAREAINSSIPFSNPPGSKPARFTAESATVTDITPGLTYKKVGAKT